MLHRVIVKGRKPTNYKGFYSFAGMNNEILNRKALYDLVWSTPLTILAKKYALSDNGLRKICLRFDIPLPTAGHWMKLQFGKAVRVPPLPAAVDTDDAITLPLRTEENVNKPADGLVNEIRNDPRLVLSVPDRLSYPDPLVVAAKECLAGKSSFTPTGYEGMLGTPGDVLDIRVAPRHVNRALCFMDTLVKGIKGRGGEILFRNRFTYARVKGQDFRIAFREKTRRVAVPGQSWTSNQPQGILYFKYDGYTSREWKDGKRPLESYIPDILARLERASDELTFEQEKNRRHLAEIRRKQEEELAQSARREKELSDFKDLLSQAERWEQAGLLRRYIGEVERRGTATAEWLEWAKKKADWYDPFVGSDDELLGGYVKNKL